MKNFLRKALVVVASFAMVLSSFTFVNVANVVAAEAEYEIYPIPQDIEYMDGEVTLGTTVNINFGSSLDDVTKQHMAETLAVLGVEQALEADFNFYVGSVGDGGEAENFINANGGYTEGLMDKIDAHIIVVKGDTIAVLGKDTDAAFYGVTTLKHIFKQVDGTVRELVIEDYADTKTRGFIEGYYGIPWSDEDRMSLMEFGGEFKMTSYIFAPKDDPYHSAQWREPYPADRLAEIKEMVEVGNANKCRFVWTIHPFMNNRITEENYTSDLAAITTKFEQLYEIGVRQFGVLADDSGNVARSTVIKLMNDLQKWVDSKGDVYSLSFCPQHYNRSWTEGEYRNVNGKTEYVYIYTEINELDAAFDEEIDIYWTGEAVCKPVSQITLDHFRRETVENGKTERRAPLFWLNWPVNDINMKRLMMGKGIELHNDVNPEDLSGVVTNPMQEAEASKVALFAVADYAWNVNSFDDDQSWADSFKYIDENAGDALHIMASHLSDSSPNGHGQNLPESEYMLDAINDFKDKFAAGNSIKVEGEALIAQFEEVVKACDDFDALSTNENLKEEINSWRLSLKDLSNAIINYIEAAIAVEEGNNSNVWSNYSEGNALFNRSKEYTRLKINNVIDTVEAGSKVLIPFATTLSQSLNGTVAGILDPSKVISTYITNREDTPTGSIDNVFDNNASTDIVYKSPNEIFEGTYVGVQYNRVIEIKDIQFRMGANSNADDTIWEGKIQYLNADGEWVDLPNGAVNSGNKNDIALAGLNLQAKGVRLIATAYRYNTWFGVKDIIINKDSIVKEETADALSGSYIYNTSNMVIADGNVANLTDGSNSTYAWFKSTGGDYMNKDAYVGINLGSLQRVGVVSLVQVDGSDGMKNIAVEYYDGNQWVTAATFTGCGAKVEVNLEGAIASQIRFRNTAQQSNWWKAMEVTAYGFSKNKNMYTDVEAAQTWSTTYTDDTFKLDAGQSTSVPAGSYVGLDLGRLRLIDYIDCPTPEGFTLQTSENGEVWKDVFDNPYMARYVRLVNTSGAAKTLNVERLQVASYEILEPHVEDTNITVEGAANLFDKNRNTETIFKNSQTKGVYVVYDFGQEIFLDTFKAVSLDSNIDWIRHGKLSVSIDNETWTEIMTFGSQDGTENPGESTTEDNINDVLPDHEVTYNCKYADNLGVVARYFKFEITQTKTGSDKWVRFTEFELNDGEDFPYTTDPTVETQVETEKAFSPLNVCDGDYASSFKAASEGKGTLVYTLDEKITRNNITILQSPTNAADAMVMVYYYDENNNTKFAQIGALSKDESLSKFVLPYGSRIASISIEWIGNKAPEICEIILGTDEKAVATNDLAALEAKIAEAKAIEQGENSESSYGFLQFVITGAENGKALLTSEAMVNGVIASLDAAIANLSTTDASALQFVIGFAETMINESNYEFGPIGYAKLEKALDEAKKVLSNHTTQKELDDATAALGAALENLVIQPKEEIELTVEQVDYKTVKLDWTMDWDAEAYNVYRKAPDSKEFKLVKSVEENSLEVSGLVTGKEYKFYVQAVNASDAETLAGEPSNEVAVATKLEGKPKLTIKKVSDSKFKLSWTSIEGATRYIVYRKRNDDKMKKVLTLGAKDLEYTTAEMPHGDYQFVVKAGRYDSKDRVMTDGSNTVKVSVEKVNPTITLTASSKAIKVSWKKIEGVTNYEVYRATSKTGKYTKLATITSTSYTAKSLTSGKTYYFKVRGYKTYKSGTDIQYKVYTDDSAVKSAKAK